MSVALCMGSTDLSSAHGCVYDAVFGMAAEKWIGHDWTAWALLYIAAVESSHLKSSYCGHNPLNTDGGVRGLAIRNTLHRNTMSDMRTVDACGAEF